MASKHDIVFFKGEAMPAHPTITTPSTKRDPVLLLMGVFLVVISVFMWKTAMSAPTTATIVVPTPQDVASAYKEGMADFATVYAQANPSPTPTSTPTPYVSSLTPTVDPIVGLLPCDDPQAAVGQLCAPLIMGPPPTPTPIPYCQPDDYRRNTYQLKPCRKPIDLQPLNPWGGEHVRQEKSSASMYAPGALMSGDKD